MPKYKSLIGRFEPVNFVDQLLSDVPAKVDTGASISSIHATDIREVTVKGVVKLRFTLLGSHDSYDYSRDITVEKYTTKNIENSFGQSERRYVVTLRIKVAHKTFNAEFTLADRSKKSFPILLGREMLTGRFIIDTSINNINKKFLETRMAKILTEDSDEE